MKKNAMTLAVCLVSFVIFPSSAADYYLKTSVPKDTAAFTTDAPTYWTDMVTKQPPTGAITSEDNCYVYENRSVQISSPVTTNFPGNAFHLGNADATSQGTIMLRASFTCSDLRWHRGIFVNNIGGSAYFVRGGTVTLDGDNQDHIVNFTTATPSSTAAGWSVTMASKLVCASADVVVDVLLRDNAKSDCYSTTSGDPVDAQIALTGNNNGFKGKIRVSKFGHLALGHANAAGDPATVRADAIELAANSRLAVQTGITPNAARGISITGAGAQIHARTYSKAGVADCTSFTLPMPITGSYGFTKMGDGTVTLSGAYTAGDIVVTNGTLVLDKTASFPRGQKVTIHDGATLVQKVYIPAIDIDCKAGGTYTKEYSFDVPYNASTGVSTPLDLTDGLEETPLRIALSEPIALPFYTTNRIDLAQVPSTATVDDFIDATPRKFGLPNASLEIEDRAGVKTLVLVATPVVVSVSAFPFKDPFLGLALAVTNWSNSAVAAPGYDYLVTNKVDGMCSVVNGNTLTFKGDSVTFGTGSSPNLRTVVSEVGNAIVYPNITFRPNNGAFGAFTFSETSSMRIVDDGSANCVNFETAWANSAQREMRVKLNLPLYGNGRVTLRTDNSLARNIEISGDNSSFTGQLRVTTVSSSSPTADNHTLCHVADAASLGGPLDAFMPDALYINQYAQIIPQKSFTFNAANRGVFVENGGFCVSNGVMLTIQQPLRVNGTLYKDGAGTLALGGAVSFGANGTTVGSKNAFRVREGAVKALSDEAVAGFAATFSDGTKIMLDPDVALTDGFTGTVAIESGATVTVDVEGLESGAVATLPICTVADDTLAFALAAKKGFRAEIVRESVTLNATACTRYSAKYAPAGFTVLFR